MKKRKGTQPRFQSKSSVNKQGASSHGPQTGAKKPGGPQIGREKKQNKWQSRIFISQGQAGQRWVRWVGCPRLRDV